jgi:hypothetical protein
MTRDQAHLPPAERPGSRRSPFDDLRERLARLPASHPSAFPADAPPKGPGACPADREQPLNDTAAEREPEGGSPPGAGAAPAGRAGPRRLGVPGRDGPGFPGPDGPGFPGQRSGPPPGLDRLARLARVLRPGHRDGTRPVIPPAAASREPYRPWFADPDRPWFSVPPDGGSPQGRLPRLGEPAVRAAQ